MKLTCIQWMALIKVSLMISQQKTQRKLFDYLGCIGKQTKHLSAFMYTKNKLFIMA